MASNEIIDNGRRCSGVDRRQFSYDFHIPKRRSGLDRRSGIDRRNAPFYHRGDTERRENV